MCLQMLRHVGRNERGNVTAEARDLLDEAGGNEMRILGGGEEHGFDAWFQAGIHARHLEFVFKIGDSPQAADDKLRAVLLGEIDQQSGKGFDLDAPGIFSQAFDVFFHQLAAQFQVEYRLLAGVERHGDNQLINHRQRPLDDVHVADGDGVERAWVDAGAGCHETIPLF